MLGSLLLALFVPAAPAETLQPFARSSSDGQWSLSVDPTQRDGGGSARYRCTHAGALVWEGERPWSFSEALVTNEGLAAGCAYSRAAAEPRQPGALHLVILAPDGSTRLDEARERRASRVMHAGPVPVARGVFEEPGRGRIVFRIAEDDRTREEWCCFTASDGKPAARFRPRDAYPEGNPRRLVSAVRAVPGTELTLVQWFVSEGRSMGIALDLLGPRDVPVAERLFLGELGNSGDKERAWTVERVREHGSLFDDPEPLRFAIGLPVAKQKLHLCIGELDGKPALVELSREPWELRRPEEAIPALADVPEVTLEEKAAFALEVRKPEPNAVRDVLAFAFDGNDVLRLARRDQQGARFALLRVDRAGKLLHEARLELPGSDPKRWVGFWPGPAGTWLATQSDPGVGGMAQAWRVEEEHGTAQPIENLVCESIERALVLEDGGFAALVTRREQYSSEQTLRVFSADGHERWRRGELPDIHAGPSLLSPADLALSGAGGLAVLDDIRHTLQLFARDGTYERTLQLDEVLGHKANYPAGLGSDTQGGFLLFDFHGTPPLYRISSAGEVRASLAPRCADGRAPDALPRNARAAPDGRLWSTDGQRIVRLDEQGVVDLALGASVDADVLAEPSATRIDALGRALIQDRASGAVHVFDGRGRRLLVCRPEPGDIDDPSPIAPLVATRGGGVALRAKKQTLRFAPDGARLAPVPNPGQAFVVSLVAEHAYATEFRGALLELGADLALERRIERGPEGSWLDCAGALATAADGAVAIVDGGDTTLADPVPASLVLFPDPSLAAPRRFALPRGAATQRLALGKHWAVVSNFGPVALLVRRSDGRLLRFRVPVQDSGASCRFGFDPQTQELLVLEGSGRLRRLALPADVPR